MEIRITGGAKLRAVAAEIKALGDKGLGKQMSAALRQAAKPVQAAIRTEIDDVMPSRGGYRATISKTLRFRTAVKTSTRQSAFVLTTYADGTSQRRDIVALNAGRLRHPVYGRSRTTRHGRQPNPWSATRIRAGFFDRGTAKAAAAAEEEMGKVLDEFRDQLAGR